jgi:hypothetical protein
VAGVAAVTYVWALPNGFVSDAASLIPLNAKLVASKEWLAWWSRPYFWGSNVTGSLLFRPLTILSFVATVRIAGTDAWPFVAGNVLLHGGASVLVWAVGRRLLDPAAALLGALLFAVHPLHTEAVAWVGGRGDLLATLFVLTAVLCLLHATEARGVRSAGLALAASGGYLAAVLAKEHAITLPAWYLLVWLLGDRRRAARPVGVALAGCLFAVALYVAFRLTLVEHSATGATWLGARLLERAGEAWRWAAGLATAGTYARLFLWPAALTFDYTGMVSGWTRNARVPALPVLWGAGAVLAFAAAFVWARRRHPGLALALGFVPITYAVVSAFPLTPQLVVAERFTYLPSVGACLASGWALCRLADRLAAPRRPAPSGATGRGPAAARRDPGAADLGPARGGWVRRGTTAALAALIVVLAARSAVRTLDWRSDVTIARAAVGVDPDSPLALRGLAQEAIRRGDTATARTLLERSLRGDPRRSEPYLLLAELQAARGEAEALAALAAQAARELPRHRTLLHSLGGLLWQVGRRTDAERLFTQIVGDHPTFVPSRLALGGLLLERGAAGAALEEFRVASRLEPTHPLGWLGLARAAEMLGRAAEARTYRERLQALGPPPTGASAGAPR